MEDKHHDNRRHHSRSRSAVSCPVPSDAKQRHAAVTRTARGANDLETITYQEARRRKEVLALKREWSTWSDSIAKRALHYKPIRDDSKLRGFLDAVRDYDQELLYLEFHLDGPNKIDFLSEQDTERAMASLRRAEYMLASAGWQVRRCLDLLNVYANCKATGDLVWSNVLKKTVDTGKLEVHVQYHDFLVEARHRLKPLLEELKKESSRMRWLVHHLDRNRIPLFIRQLKGDASRGNVSEMSTQEGELSPDIQVGSHPSEMTGCFPGEKVQKSPTCADTLGLKFDALETSSAAAASQVRYQVLKARENLRCMNKPEASKATWAAFREDLNAQPGSPSSERILLRHKAETRVLLAERRIQQPEAEDHAEDQEDGGSRTRDVGVQTD
ncbi:hypothetical protein F5Y06DRAFT_285736 [Hypoxylon sp. FL0890]|nr:hypothetical protein F5Y06DRAFT_285736 [Hypoxylon sp. FL0890]